MSTEAPVKPLEEQSKEELAATIAAEREKPTVAKPADAAPAEFTFKASDGTVYTADSQEALFAKVTSALENTKSAVKDRERQIFELRRPSEVKPVETKPEGKSFDKDEYYRLMESDPMQAQKYMDRHRFGIENPEELFAAMTQTQRQQQIQNETMRFYAQVPGYAKVETPELNQLLLARLTDNGRPFTAENFKLSYYELKEEGLIPSPTAAEPAKTRPKAPPAGASGAGSDVPNNEPDWSTMSRAEMAAEMRKRGLQVHA